MMDRPIVWIGSSNKSRGRAGYRPHAIVIHIMQASLGSVDSFFNDPHPAPDAPVSAHYGVGRSGEIHQYVAESDTAWHAGRVSGPSWTGIIPGINPNLYTIGIEHEGMSGQPWPTAMYESSAWLIARIANRWAVPLNRNGVIRHADIYGRKPFCPGTGLDLPVLIELAHAELLSGNSANCVDHAGATTVQSDVNLRLGAPTSHAESAGIVPRGTHVLFTGWSSNGESVHGNAHWYRTSSGDYFWAGATTDPVPSGICGTVAGTLSYDSQNAVSSENQTAAS